MRFAGFRTWVSIKIPSFNQNSKSNVNPNFTDLKSESDSNLCMAGDSPPTSLIEVEIECGIVEKFFNLHFLSQKFNFPKKSGGNGIISSRPAESKSEEKMGQTNRMMKFEMHRGKHPNWGACDTPVITLQARYHLTILVWVSNRWRKDGVNKSKEHGINLSGSYHKYTLTLTIAGCD